MRQQERAVTELVPEVPLFDGLAVAWPRERRLNNQSRAAGQVDPRAGLDVRQMPDRLRRGSQFDNPEVFVASRREMDCDELTVAAAFNRGGQRRGVVHHQLRRAFRRVATTVLLNVGFSKGG